VTAITPSDLEIKGNADIVDRFILGGLAEWKNI